MAASPPHLHLPLLLLQLFPAMIFAAAAEPTTTLHASSVSDQQRAGLIQALMGAQDLADLAKAFTVSDPSSTFPLTATLFFPKADGEDDKDPILFNNVSLPRFLDPAILGYHIVPQLLSFAELQRFPIGSRLPTLIPDASIVITNNSRFNYAINGVEITRPDLYIGGPVAVHEIASMLWSKEGILESSSTTTTTTTTGTTITTGVGIDQIGCSASISVDGKGDDLDCEHQRSNGSDGHCLLTQFPVFLCFLLCFALFCCVLGFLERER